jgi:hypothetical protein
MKWLKKFNELKSSTYFNAAKLISLETDDEVKRFTLDGREWKSPADGKFVQKVVKVVKHPDKVAALEARGKAEKKIEWFKETDRLAEKYSNYGVFRFLSNQVDQDGQIYYPLVKKAHNYYISLDFEEDIFSDNLYDWENNGRIDKLPILISIGLIPADEECKKHIYDVYEKLLYNNLVIYPLILSINLNTLDIRNNEDIEIRRFPKREKFPKIGMKYKKVGDFQNKVFYLDESNSTYYYWNINKYIEKPNTTSFYVDGLDFEEWGEYDGEQFRMCDESSANRFKNLLIDIFGNENSTYTTPYNEYVHGKLTKTVLIDSNFSIDDSFDLSDISSFISSVNKTRFYTEFKE